MVLEARISVVRHMLTSSEDIDAVTLTAAIDGLFSALFHTYIRPSLGRLREIEHGDLISWSVLSTPNRKFKAVIPFLMSDLSEEACRHAIIAEALFSLWTILDDVCDDRAVRYGAPTTLRNIGRGRTVAFLFGAVEWFRKALESEMGDDYTNQVTDALLTCANAQYERFSGDTRTVDEYLVSAADRVQFLGTAWAAGLAAMGRGREASALRELQRGTAQFGQLLNDYFDLTQSDGLRDVRAKIRNAYVIKLEEVATEPDRSRLRDLWDLSDRMAATAEFRKFATQYALAERMRIDLHQHLQALVASVRDLPLSEAQRAVLVGWLELSLKDTLPQTTANSFKTNLQRFLDGFEEVCKLIP
jgi:geranylgeranyl pyrophosphate synthase